MQEKTFDCISQRYTVPVWQTNESPPTKTNDAFETAFAAYEFKPGKDRAVRPLQPLTPWYLDAQSGGANPPQMDRKTGIRYADEETVPVPVRLSELKDLSE